MVGGMDLLRHLTEQADQLEQERGIARQQGLENARERAREGTAAAVLELLGDWEIPRAEAARMLVGASYTYDEHLLAVARVNVHLDGITFQARPNMTERSDYRWSTPVLAVAKFCPACGAWVPVLARNVEDPPEVIRALAGELPEHSTGVENRDQAERCDGTRAWWPQPLAVKPRWYVETASTDDAKAGVLAEAEALGYFPRHMTDTDDGLAFLFELAPWAQDGAEEPF